MDGYLFFNKLISDDTWKLKAVGARRRGGAMVACSSPNFLTTNVFYYQR